MTNERSIEATIQHARDAVEEAQTDDGWVMIKADMLSALLGEIERQRCSGEPSVAYAEDCSCCGVMDPVVYTAQCARCRTIQDSRESPKSEPPASREADIEDVMRGLYASEINFSVSCFWDAGYDVKLGDHLNGFKAAFTALTLDEIAQGLTEAACKHYPDSQFAAQVNRPAPPEKPTTCPHCGNREFFATALMKCTACGRNWLPERTT